MNVPYYKMYPSDFDSDERVRMMTDAELGLYVRLLNHSWMNNGLPIELDAIRRLLPFSSGSDFSENWPKVEACFPRGRDGRRRNKRQEEEREKTDLKSKVNRTNALGASERAAKKKSFANDSLERNGSEENKVRSGFAALPARESDSYSCSDSDSKKTTPQPAIPQHQPEPLDDLAIFLSQTHPKVGVSVQAIGQALVRESRNPNFSESRIRASHAAWMEYWRLEGTEEKYIPLLTNWISPGGDKLAKWLEPPPKSSKPVKPPEETSAERTERFRIEQEAQDAYEADITVEELRRRLAAGFDAFGDPLPVKAAKA